jgi:hypothetical protein
MLIIAIGVLTLLAVLGTTFVSLMKLERQATRNFIEAQEVELLNDSALDRVIGDLSGAINHFSYTNIRSPWIFEEHDLKGSRVPGELAHGRFPLDDPRAGPWVEFSSTGNRLSRYKTKVIDCAAQININGRQDSLARMIENLADAIQRSSKLGKGNAYPLYTEPRMKGQRLTGIQIIEFRNKLEGHRFRSKSQLRELIGRENYETIKDFITAHAWEDPYTFKPSDGQDEINLFATGGSGGRAVGGGGQQVEYEPAERTSPAVGNEARAPVNINTAPEEVLIACLMGVGGRRAFPFSRLNYTSIDEGAQITGQRVIGQEERLEVLPRAVWAYMRPLEYEHAFKIAQRIIAERKIPARQFRTWSTGTASQPGFIEFINQLDESFFPNPGTARILDPANPEDRRVQAEVLGGGSEISVIWQRGHDQRERQVRRDAGLPYHNQFAFYWELVKSAVVSNFNPNTRYSRVNPNAPAFVPVDKSDLVTLDIEDNRTPRKSYTTDFCFDAMGVFEVSTLGDLAESVASASPGKTVVVGSGDGGVQSVYQRRIATVVQVYDVLRHTSQFHFEKTFQGTLSSRGNRRNVVTWPEPRDALTEFTSLGSKIDGRVELAGLKDAIRLQLDPSSRQQTYRSPETVILAHGFLDREPNSTAAIRRLTRQPGGVGTREFSDRLADVFDANYSRPSPQLRKFYRRIELQSRGAADIQLRAQNIDPIVDVLENGPDLRPDGFHTSLFTTGHLGGRFLLLPAHQSIVNPVNPKSGPRAQLVGAGHRQPAPGNVPYYSGGIAFWVKFEFDARDPVFSGLIGCTQVIEPAGMTPPKDSEGTQFYIFKNTKGQLRVVRMYYHQAFLGAGGAEGGASGGEGSVSSGLAPPVEISKGGGGGGGGGEEQVLDLDPLKPIARSDVLIDISHFKAREWHHLAVDWNDSNPSQSIQVYIDFEKTQGGGPFIAQEEISDTPTAWVRLNVRDPKDGLFVGGFIRHQAEADAGVFKWYTNTSRAGDSRRRGLQIIEPSVKRILANATIDELVTYTGTFPGVRSYFIPRGSPGYFTNQVGEYANLFEIPLPPGVDRVVLRSFDWTAYYPSFFTDFQTRSPMKLQIQPITCQVNMISHRGAPSQFQDPWRDASQATVTNRVAGYEAARREGSRPGSNAELYYRFTINPGRAQAGSLAGGAVQTPAIDDVTLTYYLPDPKILHQEEIE